jgi:hypothetical protein
MRVSWKQVVRNALRILEAKYLVAALFPSDHNPLMAQEYLARMDRIMIRWPYVWRD